MQAVDQTSWGARLARDSAWVAISALYLFTGLGFLATPQPPNEALLDGTVRGLLWTVGAVLVSVGLTTYRMNIEAAGHALLVAGTAVHLAFQILLADRLSAESLTVVFALASISRAWHLWRGTTRVKIYSR